MRLCLAVLIASAAALPACSSELEADKNATGVASVLDAAGLLFAAVLAATVWLGVLGWKWLRASDKRRIAEHVGQEIAAQRTEALLDAPGFTPSHPLRVRSAAAVEPRAEAIGCPVCHGPLHVQEHEATTALGEPMRRVHLKCGSCGRVQTVFAVIERVRPN